MRDRKKTPDSKKSIDSTLRLLDPSADSLKQEAALTHPQSPQTPNPAIKIPNPVFTVGVSKVRWKPMLSFDWGLVMGMRYRWAEHISDWQWQYYIVLDDGSPSRQWTQFDWGWQDDLETLPHSHA